MSLRNRRQQNTTPQKPGAAPPLRFRSAGQPKIMFETLTDKLQCAFKNIRGQGKLSEEHLDAGLSDIREAVLEGDVNVGGSPSPKKLPFVSLPLARLTRASL
jgi:hypothetical protein